MAIDLASLLDDVDALKRLIVGMARKAAHVSTLIAKLRGEFARWKRARFGTLRRRSFKRPQPPA